MDEVLVRPWGELSPGHLAAASALEYRRGIEGLGFGRIGHAVKCPGQVPERPRGPPAVVALFLYSLLPIIRNTYAGLKDIPPAIVESAQALGLPSRARLRIVELPLATRSILAGIKTSAVINVGTATLSALIGAGGYGQPILTGIRLDDMGLILQGAIPAAVLALLVQGLFELVERGLLPQGLRLQAESTKSAR